MSHKNLKIKVDTREFNLQKAIPKVDKISRTGTRRIAEEYRDTMKKNFRDESYRTAYGSRSRLNQNNPKSLSNFLVVSDKIGGDDYYTVGPKIGSMNTSNSSYPNVRTYTEIFQFQEQGYSGEPYVFGLREDRAGASPTGVWAISYRKPKEFANKTWKQYQTGKLEKETRQFIQPLLDKEFKR